MILSLFSAIVLNALAAVSPPADVCQLMSAPAVSAIMGRAMKPEAEDGPVQTCTAFDKAKKRLVTISLITNDTAKLRHAATAAEYFANSRAEYSSDPARGFAEVPAVGDEAFRAALAEMTFVFVRKGERVLRFSIAGFNEADQLAIATTVAAQL